MSKGTMPRTTLERFAAIFMAFVCGISLLAAAGWMFNRPTLASLNPEFIPMPPATALLFLGLCVAWLIQRVFPARHGMRLLVQACLLGMLVIVLILGLRYFTGLGPDLEKLLYPNPPSFGQTLSARMSPLSALGFLLAIPAFLLLTGGKPIQRTKSAAADLALSVFILNGIVCLGYLFDAPLFYGGTIIPVALTTAISFLFLSLGQLMTAGPSCWPLRMYVGHSLKARLMRAFIPASLLIVLLQGLLSTVATPWIVNPALKVAVGAFLACLIVMLIITFIANNLSSEFERGRKAEQALLQSEAELRALFASMHDVVLVIGHDGVYREIAPTNPGLLVRPPQELLGKTLREVFPPEQAETFLNVVQQVLDTKQTAQIEYALAIGDRTLKFETSISPMTEDSTLWVARDITERKRVEQSLQENEEKFRNLFNNAEVGMFRTRLDGSEILDINEKGLALFGLTREEMQGSASVLHWADPREREEMVRRLEAKGRVIDFECGMLDKQGQVRRCLTSMRLYREQGILEGSIIDITERKQAEEALRQAEVKYHNIFENAMEGIFQSNPAGKFSTANPALARMLGYDSPEELISRVNDLNHKFYVQPGRRAEFMNLMNKNGMISNFESEVYRRDGSTIWISENIQVVRDDHGQILNYEGTLEDITKRKRFESAQDAIFRITQTAITSEGIDALYHSIHSILGELIPAENFYIALIDPASNLISFPYYVDQYDKPPTGMTQLQGLTGYVIRSGRSLLATREILDQLVGRGEVEAVGTLGVDWMGAPLKVEERIIGVMAVQSYKQEIHFDQEDLNLLEFVSTQVAQAIERKRMEQEIQSLSLTDELTGLYNRRGFTLMVEHEVKLAHRIKRTMLLFFCDVDDLKTINDTHGHAQGDLALKEVSAILKKNFREVDILGRFGGDEFVILALDASLESTETITNRLQTALEAHNQQGDRPYHLTLSLGFARYDPEAPCTLSDLLAQADRQMYNQKQAKKLKE